MKLNSLFETEQEALTQEISLKDVYYDPRDSERSRNLFVMNKFKSVSPGGARPKSWPGVFELRDIPELTSLEGFPEEVDIVQLQNLPNLKSLSGMDHCKIKEDLHLQGFSFKNFNDISNVSVRRISIYYGKIESFEGLPKPETLYLAHSHVHSFEGLPELKSLAIFGKLNGNDKSINLNDLSKNVKVEELKIRDFVFEGSLINFLNIKGLKSLEVILPYEVPNFNEASSAIEIIVNGIKHGKDIFDVQEELIDAGLDEFAK